MDGQEDRYGGSSTLVDTEEGEVGDPNEDWGGDRREGGVTEQRGGRRRKGTEKTTSGRIDEPTSGKSKTRG